MEPDVAARALIKLIVLPPAIGTVQVSNDITTSTTWICFPA